MRAFVRATLEEDGNADVEEAESGFQALRILPRATFDLVIVDINMPDINGLELIGFVKSNPTYQNIPLIIVTTEKTEEDKKRGMALGAAAYIAKPFRKEDLVSIVKKTLEGGK